MPKVIIDTNVLISSLIQKSYPFLIIDELFVNEEIRLCISDEILREYLDVINREKFSKYREFQTNAKSLIEDIEKYADKYFPVKQIYVLKDAGDNKFLELAEISKADYLVTGNTKHFKIKKFRKTKIVSPKEFWETELNY
ncbi:MAG TPA: putative toxin-antitoxin system toxin component, PIN family [Chitinophagaceae bacterium]|nr:putative toxin-antitoxin system toxin component, PIN family [Chitinophagaceae bacterium]